MSEQEHVLARAEANQLDRPDRPRDDAGRFASKSAEPEYGRTAELHEAGLRSLADVDREAGIEPGEPRIFNSNNPADLAAAHHDRQERQRAKSSDQDAREAYVKQWRDSVGEPVPLEDDVAVTKDEAFERISQRSKAHAAEAVARQHLAQTEAIAKDLGVPVNWDGHQQAQAEQQQPVAEQPQPEPQPGDLSERTKELLNDPVLRGEIDQRFAIAEQARAQYEQGLQSAAELVLHQTLAEFPALRNISEAQLGVALQVLADSDPQQYARAKAAVEKVQMIGNELHRTRQARAVAQQQEFNSWARVQDAAFETAVPAELRDPARRAEIAREIFDGAREMGVSPEQLMHAYATDPTIRSAPVQKMMLEAAMWRRAQRAKDAATAKPLPSVPVQRPGVQAARPSSSTMEYQNLDRKLDKLQGRDQVRAAAKMLSMRRRGGR
jgi:hypothetical protein